MNDVYRSRDATVVKGDARAYVADRWEIGGFELRVLLAIAKLGGSHNSAYGAAIQRELGMDNDKEVCLGAVYVTLDRLEKRGLIASYQGVPMKVRGGGPKRIVKLEPKGVRALKSYKERLLALQSLDFETLEAPGLVRNLSPSV